MNDTRKVTEKNCRLWCLCYYSNALSRWIFPCRLHPGNLMIMDGPNGPQVGFIDLGMVGKI